MRPPPGTGAGLSRLVVRGLDVQQDHLRAARQSVIKIEREKVDRLEIQKDGKPAVTLAKTGPIGESSRR